MKIKNTVIISEEKLNNQIEAARHAGIAVGIEKSATQVKDLKKAVKNREADIEALTESAELDSKKKLRQIERLEAEVEVYEADREEARELIKTGIENEDQKAALDARKKQLDAKEATLRDRESKIDSKEETNYKKGYADGIADGLRKISEITAQDRQDAMKIAMVSAASHTPTANLKELNSVHQITEGSSDSEG